MKSILLRLIIIFSICLPSLCQAQRYIDHFDPDNIRLARLVWDDSLDNQTINWLQACVDTAHHEIRLWALHVIGVHLEQMPVIIDRSQHWEQFQKNLIGHLNTAKQKTNIDSYLISLIDTTDLVTHHSHRATMSHFLFDIVADRQVRQIRKSGMRNQDMNSRKFVEKFGSDYNRYYLALATKSDKETLRLADSLLHTKDDELRDSPLGWALTTYRGRFLKDFEKYYQPAKFNRLSSQGQAKLLHYWSFNNDLINAEDKVKILKLLNIKPSDKTETNLIIQKLLLRSLILKRSRGEYSNEIHERFNSKETERYKEMTRQRVLAQNQVPKDTSRRSTTTEQKELPVRSGPIRPEDLVTMFDDCTEEELLEYLEKSLKIELYKIPGPKKIQEVIDVRAAMRVLGNMYYSQNGIQANQSRYDSIVHKLITIGTLEVDNSFSEATKLIYFLGNPAIPYLKKEYLNMDLKRADFAMNKLIALKNRNVVVWLIRLTETHPDPMIKSRGRHILKIMKNHRDLQMPNRGITKEESDRIAREVIEPYLERN